MNNPQSAEGFTVIFNTARDQKKNDRSNSGNSAGGNQRPNQNNQGNQRQHHKQNDQQHNSVRLENIISINFYFELMVLEIIIDYVVFLFFADEEEMVKLFIW